ncbi:MAG TPA: hypothetical protein ENI59_02405 [Euryarchaeota archaeon]|nr:hypothetical protein [Euryarchaeota archaeon]
MQSSEKKVIKRIWRRPTREEGSIIISKLEYFGQNVPENILRDHTIYILEITRREAFLVRKDLSELIEIFQPYSVGITLGEFKGKTFTLSLAGGYLVSKYASRKRVFLDKEGSISFIYGKDASGPDIEDWDPDIEDDDIVIVLNEEGKFLGFGKARVANLRVVEIKNVIDIGWYLRSELDERK